MYLTHLRGGRNELDYLQGWLRAIAKRKSHFLQCKEGLKKYIDPLHLGGLSRIQGGMSYFRSRGRDDGDTLHHFQGVWRACTSHASDSREDIERYIDVSLAKAVTTGRLLNGRISDQLRCKVAASLKAIAVDVLLANIAD
jgi:hypothetical protein